MDSSDAKPLPNSDLYPGDDSLPDISKTRFDHTNKKGNLVKFLWGVATSSYQVEGGITKNDWDVFSSSEGVRERVNELARLAKINLHLEVPGKAVGHWDLDVFCEDLRRAKSLGIDTYRLSLEWSRIQPKKPQSTDQGLSVNPHDFEQDAVLHYGSMLDLLTELGIAPIVTLNHITLPAWVLTPPTNILGEEDGGFKESLGGWQNPATVDAFAKYVEFVVGKFKDKVRYWITINEPLSIFGLGYIAGMWSPGFIASGARARKALFNLVEAHVQAYDIIKRLAADAKVGIAHGMIFPKEVSGILGFNKRAAAQYDYLFNRCFLEAVVDGMYNPTMMLGSKDTGVIERWKGRLDFVGLNYYRSAYIYENELLSLTIPWLGGIFDEDLSKSGKPHGLLNDLGWEVYPGGLYRILKYVDERFGLPVLITENGFAEQSDSVDEAGPSPGKRAPYVVAHLSQVLHAIKEGIDVLGYVHWSLVDNWEWEYDYMPKARFGLYTVNRPASGDETSASRSKTNGAAALEYVIGKGGMGDAVSKFGTITPCGTRLVPPTKSD